MDNDIDVDIEIYKEILSGKKRKKFPNGYWKDIDGKVHAQKLTKFMLENVLYWNHEDIKNKLMVKVFREHKLGGMLSSTYRDSYFELINEIYPNQFKPWEFNQTYSGFWTLENAAIATKWMIEERLNWSDQEIKEKLTGKTFLENNLCGMLSGVFKTSPYDAIENAYPGRFKPWEMKMSPMGLWTIENAILATQWLIEEKLKWTKHDIATKLTGQIFADNNLCGMLSTSYNDSVYKSIDSAYPNQFKPWELKMAPMNFWNEITAGEATRWMIEEKLNWTKIDIQNKLTQYTFHEHGLGGMLMLLFSNSTFKGIDNAYPDVFKPWQLIKMTSNFWIDRENVIEAVNWFLLRQYGHIPSKKFIMQNIKQKDLIKNDLDGLLRYYKENVNNILNVYFEN